MAKKKLNEAPPIDYGSGRERMSPDIEGKLRSQEHPLGKHQAFPDVDKNGIPDNFEELIYSTFLTLKMSNLRLAGLYPVNNYYFLKDKITTDLRFIIGQVKIFFNTPICEKRDFYLLEDFETTHKYPQYASIVHRKKDIDIRLLRSPEPQTLTTLWIGENINPIVELAWLSWLKQGYKVNVYQVNICKENLSQGIREFLDKKLFFKNALSIHEFNTADEILPLSDLWRYKFLYEKGGIWIDSDMVLLDQIPNTEFIISTEHTFQSGGRKSKLSYKPNIGILKFNKNNNFLDKVIKRIEKYSILDKPQFTDNMRFFQAELKKHKQYEKYYLEPNLTCGIPWWDYKEIYKFVETYTTKYDVEVKDNKWFLNNSIALHLWNNFSTNNKVDIDGANENSIYKILCKLYH